MKGREMVFEGGRKSGDLQKGAKDQPPGARLNRLRHGKGRTKEAATRGREPCFSTNDSHGHVDESTMNLAKLQDHTPVSKDIYSFNFWSR
jgi:hypothetical protein